MEPEDIIKQEVDSDSNFENGYDDETIHDFVPQEEKTPLRSSTRIQNQQQKQLGDEKLKFKDFDLDSYQSESEDASSDNDHDDHDIDFEVGGSDSDFVIEEEVEECQKSPKISEAIDQRSRVRVLKKNAPVFPVDDGCISDPSPVSVIICPLCKIHSFATNCGDELCQHLDECSHSQAENQTESLFNSEKDFTLRCPVCSTFEATINDKVNFAEHMGACGCTEKNSGILQTQIPLSNRLFSCDICPEKKYLRFEPFLIHWLFHKKNVYKCTICEKTFQHKEVVTSHVASDHSNDPGITPESPAWTICSPTVPTVKWLCPLPLCNETFPNDGARDDHVRDSHPDCQLLSNLSENENCKQCDWCEKQFCSDDELSLHSVTAHFTLRNLCDICNLHFQGENLFRFHRIEVHGVKFLYTCYLCEAEIPSNIALSKHATVHAKSRINGRVCPVCHKVFHNAGRVSSHIRMVHENGSSFRCDVDGCGMEFTNLHRLTSHKAGTHKIGKFKCTVENCDDVFGRPYLLEQHVARVHTKEFRFFCAVCGQGFYNSCSWKRHEKYAHVPPSFICDICGKAFKTKENLSQHQRFHKPKSTN